MRLLKKISLALLMAFIPACTTMPDAADTNTAAGVSVKSLLPRARAALLASLADPAASTRTHAIEVAATTNQKNLMPEILKLLGDRSVPVRFAAATAIGEMVCHGCREQAEKALQDTDENIRIAAAYSIARLGDNSHIPLIRQATKSGNPTVSANALLLLGKLGNKGDIALLYKAMRNNDAPEKVRFSALESIAMLGDDKICREKLWPLLISKYADDRVTGIRAMGALGSAEAKTAIQTMLFSDDVIEVRLAAAEQLGRLNDQSGQDEVLAYFATRPDLNQSTISNGMAVMAIGRIGSEKLAAYLPAALQSTSNYIRLAAAQSVLLMEKQQ